jgi:putative ABC transport system permease protein
MNVVALPFAFLRLLTQSVLLALAQIWANKARAALTTIGIVIGVASVTTVVAVLTGLKQNVLSEFEAFGTNKMYILPQNPTEGPLHNAPWHVIRFTPEQFDGLRKHCPSVGDLTRVGFFDTSAQAGGRSLELVRIMGIDPSWHRVENRSVQIGRPFSVVDIREARPVCLVPPEVRDKLRLNRDCTGQTIVLAHRTFTIVGVVEPRFESAMFGGQDKTLEVQIPFTTAWKWREPWLWIMGIATCRTPDVADEALAEIRFYLRRVRDLKPGEPDTFRVEVMQKYLQQFKAVAMAITVVAAGVVGISLLVGGVGIMNIMLVSVSERTREIGLRKAVGARPSAILLQFLVEAVMLCFFGGFMGVVVAGALTRLMVSIPNAHLDKAAIPLWAIGVSFGFAAAVGVFFGMFPAIKAARLDPIEALRHE